MTHPKHRRYVEGDTVATDTGQRGIVTTAYVISNRVVVKVPNGTFALPYEQVRLINPSNSPS